MSWNVTQLVDYQPGWRPAWLACFWCGHDCGTVTHESTPYPAECPECGMGAMTISHELEPPFVDGMSEEEFEPLKWRPV